MDPVPNYKCRQPLLSTVQIKVTDFIFQQLKGILVFLRLCCAEQLDLGKEIQHLGNNRIITLQERNDLP